MLQKIKVDIMLIFQSNRQKPLLVIYTHNLSSFELAPEILDGAKKAVGNEKISCGASKRYRSLVNQY